MNDPDPNDDTWGDLARELGVEKATPARPAQHPVAPAAQFGHASETEPLDEPSEGSAFADGTEADLEDADESDADSAEGEAGAGDGGPGEGPPGTGRKRRRRRRRRKKSGVAPGAADEAESMPATITAPEEAEADTEDEPTYDTEDEAMEIESETVPLAADEDAGGDVLRELIATWNVPSWDEIVGQLHRPGR